MIRFVLPLAAMIGTAACVPSARPEAQAPAAPQVCDAAPAQSLVGKKRGFDIADRARKASGATKLRWIAPGQMVTMDYREDRLNLYVDAAGTITRVSCG